MSKLSKLKTIYYLLALDKVSRALKIITDNGGLYRSGEKLWRQDTLKEGTFMGSDCFGNKYYENPFYMLGRSRWVEYNPQFKWEYDASQVTPDWYGWLHYKTDKTPCEDEAKQFLNCCCWCHKWLQPHEENMSATDRAYFPYSTTRERFHLWDGCSISSRQNE